MPLIPAPGREAEIGKVIFSYILNLRQPGLHQSLPQKEKQKTKTGRGELSKDESRIIQSWANLVGHLRDWVFLGESLLCPLPEMFSGVRWDKVFPKAAGVQGCSALSTSSVQRWTTWRLLPSSHRLTWWLQRRSVAHESSISASMYPLNKGSWPWTRVSGRTSLNLTFFCSSWFFFTVSFI